MFSSSISTFTPTHAAATAAHNLTVRMVFDRYRLNRALRLHIFRVTSLMELLLKAWRGPVLDQPILLETMLLHDLGNLVKFDLSSDSLTVKQLMTPAELPVYQALQADWLARYGSDVDEVTCRLIAELPLQHGERISQLIRDHNPATLAATVASSDWAQKLCDYTDFRVGPAGLVTLAERFADLAQRYQTRHALWQDPAENQRRLQLFQTLETQLQAHLNCDLHTLTATDLGNIDRWNDYGFATSGILSVSEREGREAA